MAVSWSGHRGTVVGTIGADSLRLPLLDGDDDFTTTISFCQLHFPNCISFVGELLAHL